MGIKDKLLDIFTVQVPVETDVSRDAGEKSTSDLTSAALPLDLDATSIETSADIVSEAYTHFNGGKFDIFKVEELSVNFEGIPEDTKNQLIRRNLETLNIDLSDLINEANQRKSTIEAVAQEHVAKSEALGKDIDSQIADAKSKIDKLSAQNIERKNKITAELAGAKAETKRLDAIITILGGTTSDIS